MRTDRHLRQWRATDRDDDRYDRRSSECPHDDRSSIMNSQGKDLMYEHDGNARQRAIQMLVDTMGGGNVTAVSCGIRGPWGLRMDDRPLIVIAGDQGEPLDHTLLRPLAIEENCDVVATYVDEFKSGHPFLFDGRPPAFVPEHGAGPSIRIIGGVLKVNDEPSGLTKEQRLIGVAQGQAELQRRIHIAPPSDDQLAKDRHIDAHPAKLIVVLPMYEAADYRRRLTAIDDALVVHRRGDGRFQFELRPMFRLGPRSYAKWVIGLAADLEAGHVVIIVDRDAFLADIQRLAFEHVAECQRAAVERAIVILAERTRYQIQDHLDGEDDEARMRRRLIAKRPRRTTAKPYEQDGLNCIAGIPTPRAEQLWNSILGEWCDIRTNHHGRAAWERWARGNRPGMPGL